MREYKFRGKHVDGKWRYAVGIKGGWVELYGGRGIQLGVFFSYIDRGLIDPATVGQWTGLVDCKGVEIYEGDVVRIVSEMEDAAGEQVVKWHNEGGYFAEIFDGGDFVPMIGADDYTVTVIRNIYEVAK